MKNLYLLLVLFTLGNSLVAQSDGPRSAGTFSTVAIPGSNKTWLQPGNVASTDNLYSNFFNLSGGVGSYTDYLVATNYGFSIPAGAFVTGISVEVEMADPNGRTSDYRVRIVKNNVIGEADRSLGAYPTADTYINYGGPGDLWGESWSSFDINSSGFGIALSAQRSATGGSTGGRIDHIRITVFYTNPMTLPVRLIYFNANKINNGVTVKWKTTDETNMSGYTVERSSNGNDFTAIHSIPSQNNSGETNYIYTDNKPLTNTTSYYRLRMTGANGETKYSQVVSVQFTDNGSVDLYPSILSYGQMINIRGELNGSKTIRIFSMNGQRIATMTTRERQFSSIIVEQQRGMMFYQVLTEEGKLVGQGRLMIQ